MSTEPTPLQLHDWGLVQMHRASGSITGLAFLITSILVLFVGQINPTSRLHYLGLPIDTLAIVVAMLGIVPLSLGLLDLSLLLRLWPILPLGVTLLWSTDLEYGVYKFGNLVLISGIVLVYFDGAVRRMGLRGALLAFIGIWYYRRDVGVRIALSIILSQVFIVALTYAVHESRLVIPILPLVYLLSGLGLVSLLDKLNIRIDA